MNNAQRYGHFTEPDQQHYILQAKKQEEYFKQAIDFTQIFELLYELFEERGVLDKESVSKDGISFRMGHPDYNFQTDDETVVVYELIHREFLTQPTPAGNIRQVKSKALLQQRDIVTGQVKQFQVQYFSNKVTLTVHSNSTEKLYQVVKYVESCILASRGKLHGSLMSAPIYEGMTESLLSSNQHKYRMFSRTLVFTFVTSEISSYVTEEIENIDYNHINY